MLGSAKCQEDIVLLYFFAFSLFSLLFSVVVLWGVCELKKYSYFTT